MYVLCTVIQVRMISTYIWHQQNHFVNEKNWICLTKTDINRIKGFPHLIGQSFRAHSRCLNLSSAELKSIKERSLARNRYTRDRVNTVQWRAGAPTRGAVDRGGSSAYRDGPEKNDLTMTCTLVIRLYGNEGPATGAPFVDR